MNSSAHKSQLSGVSGLLTHPVEVQEVSAEFTYKREGHSRALAREERPQGRPVLVGGEEASRQQAYS